MCEEFRQGSATVPHVASCKITRQHSAGGWAGQEGTSRLYSHVWWLGEWDERLSSAGTVRWSAYVWFFSQGGLRIIGFLTRQPRAAWPFMTQSQNHIAALPPYPIGPSLPRFKRQGHRSHLWKEGVSKILQHCFKTAMSVDVGRLQQEAPCIGGKTMCPSSLKGMVRLQVGG